MTEQPETSPRSDEDEEDAQASQGKDPGRAGGGRTEGETAVDDAMGQGTTP